MKRNFETENKRKLLNERSVAGVIPSANQAHLRGQKLLPVQVAFNYNQAKGVLVQRSGGNDSKENQKLPQINEDSASPLPSNKFIQTTAR